MALLGIHEFTQDQGLPFTRIIVTNCRCGLNTAEVLHAKKAYDEELIVTITSHLCDDCWWDQITD